MTLEIETTTYPEAFRGFYDTGPPLKGLPPEAYTQEALWQRECQTLFRHSWVFVSCAHELAKPGDVIPVSVAGQPILLVHGKDGEIRAFHNVCRHRCLKLVERAGNVGPMIRCPYHTWVYGLDGALRSTPYFGGPDSHAADGFEAKHHGLVPVRLGRWHDWIFVNLSADAPTFETFIAPLARQLNGLDLATFTPVATLDFGEVHCNWKLLMENFIEPYHVQFVHNTTTQQPLKNHATVVDGHCLGSLVDVEEESGSQVNGRNDQTLAVSSRYLTLFPNFVLGRYFPDQIGIHLNTPLAADRTHQKRIIYKFDGAADDPGEVRALKDLWFKVHKEDHEMCERLQSGRASAAADGGVLSPHWETSVRRFQELVVEALTQRPVDP